MKAKEPIKKKRPGQAGSADTSAFVRQDNIVVRVNHHEKKRIKQLSMERGFETMAHYVRSQVHIPLNTATDSIPNHATCSISNQASHSNPN
jgi:hypothetical protein